MTQTATPFLQAAWNLLQATPSYCERQAASFAATTYDECVLALTHTPECLEALQVSYVAQQSYITAHPAHCQHCNGTGQEEVWEYPNAPNWLTECSQCVLRGICPSCGASGFAPDGCEPCPVCGFEVGEDGLPERAFCVCGADRVLYEGDAQALPEFPE